MSERVESMKNLFTAEEMETIYWALERLTWHHEEKANISNETGINTQFKLRHATEANKVRTLAIEFDIQQ